MAESNRIFNLVTPFIEQIQDVENMLDDLRKYRLVSSAVGQQLDNIGDIVDLARAGLADEDYRAAILRKIVLNISSGQPETIILYTELICESEIDYRELATATINLDVYSLPDPISLFDGLTNLKPVGVKIDIKYTADKSLAFNFADEDGHVTDGLGFSEAGYPAGDVTAGKFSEAITIY